MKNNSKSENSLFNRYPKTTIIFTLVVSIVVLDVFLTKTYNYFINNRKIRIRHPIYHHTFRENSKSSETFLNKKYPLFTNSLGFKDKLIRTIPLKSTKRRILFIGDSVTQGLGIRYEDTFVGLIGTELINKKIEVLNAGRSSYAPIIYWKKVKHLIEDVGLRFDEVVVFIDISDAWDQMARYRLPDTTSVVSLDDPISQSTSKPRAPIKILIRQNTTVIYYISNLLHDLLFFNKKEEEEPNDPMTLGGFFTNYNHFHKYNWFIDDEMWKLYGKKEQSTLKLYMNKLLKLLRLHSIDLTIAVYPWPTNVWYEDLNSIHVDIWEKWSQENNVKFINYFPDFVAIGLSKIEKLQVMEKYYISTDVHFNEEGHKVIANKFLNTYLW